jgi:hypothetical protein
MRYVKVLMGAWPIRHRLNAPVLEDRGRLGGQRMLVGSAFAAPSARNGSLQARLALAHLHRWCAARREP